MMIPNLSNSMYVAHLRYIQSIHEPPERRNPDTLVRYFLPVLQRFRSAWLSRADLATLRADPFYYYLIARTKYYDQVVEEAVSDGVKQIISVGCGSDTRAYRFKDLLCGKGVKVLECDQAESITAKQVLAKRWPHLGHVEYLPIDLNDGTWPELELRLAESKKSKALVLMEGVSPYVNYSEFSGFLQLLATRLAPGSYVAYDFKIAGLKDDFGRAGRTQKPFRLSTSVEEATAFHKGLGLRLEHMELSAEACARVLPDLEKAAAPMFSEDGLVRLRVD